MNKLYISSFSQGFILFLNRMIIGCSEQHRISNRTVPSELRRYIDDQI